MNPSSNLGFLYGGPVFWAAARRRNTSPSVDACVEVSHIFIAAATGHVDHNLPLLAESSSGFQYLSGFSRCLGSTCFGRFGEYSASSLIYTVYPPARADGQEI